MKVFSIYYTSAVDTKTIFIGALRIGEYSEM